MNKEILLVGGGGHCKSVIDVIESTGYNILGILDVAENVGNSILGYEVLGTDENIKDFVHRAEFLITIGQIKNPLKRREIADKIKKAGGRFATIVAPDAYVSKYTTIGEGSIIMHRAFLNADVHVGKHCIINTMTNLGHEVVVGDFCHISTGVMVCGNVAVDDNVFIGSQSVVNEATSIVTNCIIGSMSCVNRSITTSGTYVGVPVKKI